jgi:hypothetical protein
LRHAVRLVLPQSSSDPDIGHLRAEPRSTATRTEAVRETWTGTGNGTRSAVVDVARRHISGFVAAIAPIWRT